MFKETEDLYLVPGCKWFCSSLHDVFLIIIYTLYIYIYNMVIKWQNFCDIEHDFVNMQQLDNNVNTRWLDCAHSKLKKYCDDYIFLIILYFSQRLRRLRSTDWFYFIFQCFPLPNYYNLMEISLLMLFICKCDNQYQHTACNCKIA